MVILVCCLIFYSVHFIALEVNFNVMRYINSRFAYFRIDYNAVRAFSVDSVIRLRVCRSPNQC